MWNICEGDAAIAQHLLSFCIHCFYFILICCSWKMKHSRRHWILKYHINECDRTQITSWDDTTIATNNYANTIVTQKIIWFRQKHAHWICLLLFFPIFYSSSHLPQTIKHHSYHIDCTNDLCVLIFIVLFLSLHCVETASLPGTNTAHQLVVAIRQKCTADEVLNILNDLPNPENDNDMIDATYNPLKIDVFVQTLLNLGSKSFSHSFAAIAKFHQVFRVNAGKMHFNGTSFSWNIFDLSRRLPIQRKLKFACCTMCLNSGVHISRWCVY